MQTFPINFIALVVAGLVRTFIGFVWYSPAVFGRPWKTLVGCTDAEMTARLPRAMVLDVFGNVLMAFVLVHAVHYAGASSAAQGAAVGFFNWLGFVMIAMLFTVTFEGRPFRLFLINNGFQVLSLLAMGAIVAVWT